MDFAHKHFPGQVKAKLGNPGHRDPARIHTDNSKSINKLGIVYHPKEETFKDTIAQLLQFERREGL